MNVSYTEIYAWGNDSEGQMGVSHNNGGFSKNID